MTVTVSSGNTAKLTLTRNRMQAVLDVHWARPHTAADIQELNRLLNLENRSRSITIEDDALRAAYTRAVLSGTAESERVQ